VHTILPPPPSHTLFPYTTLFRSCAATTQSDNPLKKYLLLSCVKEISGPRPCARFRSGMTVAASGRHPSFPGDTHGYTPFIRTRVPYLACAWARQATGNDGRDDAQRHRTEPTTIHHGVTGDFGAFRATGLRCGCGSRHRDAHLLCR